MQAPVAGQPMDPAAGASSMPDPNAAAPVDPNAMGATDPNMGMDPTMADPTMAGGATGDIGMEGDVDVEDILKNQIGLDGKELAAASGYIEYLKKNPYDSISDNAPMEDPAMGMDAGMDPNAAAPVDPNAQPMMEMIFKKGQLEKLREGIGLDDKEEAEDKPTSKKKDRGFNRKSPFGSKKFGQSSL